MLNDPNTIRECPECGRTYNYENSESCPECGHFIERKIKSRIIIIGHNLSYVEMLQRVKQILISRGEDPDNYNILTETQAREMGIPITIANQIKIQETFLIQKNQIISEPLITQIRMSEQIDKYQQRYRNHHLRKFKK